MTKKEMKLGVPNREGQLSMMFTRGGARNGAGRKGLGETRKVSLTLSREAWIEIENRCGMHNCSKSEILRSLIEASLLKPDQRDR